MAVLNKTEEEEEEETQLATSAMTITTKKRFELSNNLRSNARGTSAWIAVRRCLVGIYKLGSFRDWDAAENDGLGSEARAKAEEDTPVHALAGGGEALLGRAPAHLVEDEEHAGAGHVAVLSEDVACGAEPGLVKPQLGLGPVQDGRAAGVRHPEDGVPVGDAQRLERRLEQALDVRGDEVRHAFLQVEGEAHLAEVAQDGVVRVRHERLLGRHQLEQRPLAGGLVDGAGADHDRRRAVAEEGLADHGVDVGGGGPAEGDGGDLGAHDEHPCAAVVLGEVLGDAEHGAAGEAALVVEHDPVHRGPQAQELGGPEVGAGHVHAGGGAEDEVGDLGPRLAPLSQRLLRRLRAELGHLLHKDVVPHVERRRRVRGHVGVLLQELLRHSAWYTQFGGVAVPIASTVATPSARCAFLISSAVTLAAISSVPESKLIQGKQQQPSWWLLAQKKYFIQDSVSQSYSPY
ncbi:hypothetical protein EJB05_27606, partial [Eragrostis curvula]